MAHQGFHIHMYGKTEVYKLWHKCQVIGIAPILSLIKHCQSPALSCCHIDPAALPQPAHKQIKQRSVCHLLHPVCLWYRVGWRGVSVTSLGWKRKQCCSKILLKHSLFSLASDDVSLICQLLVVIKRLTLILLLVHAQLRHEHHHALTCGWKSC